MQHESCVRHYRDTVTRYYIRPSVIMVVMEISIIYKKINQHCFHQTEVDLPMLSLRQ